jgi:hypothetical protein
MMRTAMPVSHELTVFSRCGALATLAIAGACYVMPAAADEVGVLSSCSYGTSAQFYRA